MPVNGTSALRFPDSLQDAAQIVACGDGITLQAAATFRDVDAAVYITQFYASSTASEAPGNTLMHESALHL